MSDSENNSNMAEQSGPNGSVEDLSEYTDADESVSAPTEILAEFLSAIMLKDYMTALKYCKLILHYEPNNSTAREFYPFIQEKIELIKPIMPWEIPLAVEGHWAEACHKFEKLPEPLPQIHHDPPLTYYNNVKEYPTFIPYDLFYNFEEGYDPRTAREDRRDIKPMFENVFKEEEKKYVPVTSQLSYGRPLLLGNVLDWSTRLSKLNVREQSESDDESSSDCSESAPNNDSSHSLSSGEESESKETDSDATSASYSSLEDEEADRENNVIETGNATLTSNDVANGNTERFRIENLSESDTGRTARLNENDELKRKLGNFVGCKAVLSSDQMKISLLTRKCTNNDRLNLLNNPFLSDEVRNKARSQSLRKGSLLGPPDEIAQPDDINAEY